MYPDTSHLGALEEELGIVVDEAFLKGQRAALQRIQSERVCHAKSRPDIFSWGSENYNSMSCRSLPSTPAILEQHERHNQTSEFNSKSSLGVEGVDIIRSQIHGRGKQRNKTLLPNSSLQRSNNTLAADDRIDQFGCGKKVLIKGASRVLRDIEEGNAVIVHCPSCSAVLQVGKGTLNLFCSVCKEISPIDNTSLGSASSQFDYEIASNVQKQEEEAVYIRIQAKQAK